MEVTDLSPGSVLVAGFTGYEYTVEGVSDGKVRCRGPNGPLVVSQDELQKDIANGKIQVKG